MSGLMEVGEKKKGRGEEVERGRNVIIEGMRRGSSKS